MAQGDKIADERIQAALASDDPEAAVNALLHDAWQDGMFCGRGNANHFARHSGHGDPYRNPY